MRLVWHDRVVVRCRASTIPCVAFFVMIALSLHVNGAAAQTLKSADTTSSVRLLVVEPYIEMHTAPGRGYPVFNVVEQGDQIEILKRKTNWYKVRSSQGKLGWTKASQLAHTLQPAGLPADLPSVGHGDYLTSRWRVGFTSGQIDGANTLSFTAGFRPVEWVGIEAEIGTIFDRAITSDFYGFNLHLEPLPDWVVTPFVSTGLGEFSFDSRQKVLVERVGKSDATFVGGGAHYYIGRNFMVRGEFRRYSIDANNGSAELNAWIVGLNTFF